ncbi:unnamed protein product, partial [marine sediment metagenome]
MIILEYRDSKFHEASGPSVSGISLKVDDAQKKLILIVPAGASMIQRRAAERNARGISKIGFQTNAKGGVGRGFELVFEGHGGGLPDRLKHSPREAS